MVTQLYDNISSLLSHEKSKEVQLLAIDCVVIAMLANGEYAGENSSPKNTLSEKNPKFICYPTNLRKFCDQIRSTPFG